MKLQNMLAVTSLRFVLESIKYAGSGGGEVEEEEVQGAQEDQVGDVT